MADSTKIETRVTWAKPVERTKMVASVLESRGTIDLTTGEVNFFVSQLDEDDVARQSDGVMVVLSPETLQAVCAELMGKAQDKTAVPAGTLAVAAVATEISIKG